MVNDTNKQEFNDLPQALVLAIGTFGNYNLKEDSNKSIAEEESPSFHDCSFEEVGNFHNELNIILEENNFNLSNNLIYNKGKECLDKSKNGVSKKALTFFLKMFVCGGGLPPTPLFKDPLSIESRMEKVNDVFKSYFCTKIFVHIYFLFYSFVHIYLMFLKFELTLTIILSIISLVLYYKKRNNVIK